MRDGINRLDWRVLRTTYYVLSTDGKLCHGAAQTDNGHMDATQPRFRRLRWIGVGAAVLLAVGLWNLGASPAAAHECASGDWPAFMLPITESRNADTSEGWILWCSEEHWRMHVAGEIAGETESRAAEDGASTPFAWFTPNLSPEEAWNELTSSQTSRVIDPKHPAASFGYVADTDDGKFRMEFSPEGIPVRVVVPGAGGFRLWAFQLDSAGRPMWSDEDPLNWPACHLPSENGSIVEPQPCWTSFGSTRPDGRCFDNLNRLTSEFKTLGCSL